MTPDPAPAIGDDIVEVGPIAHGGHCVARLDGRVVFVRHALPGERVRIRVTDTTHDAYWRADAYEVLESSPDRVASRCPAAGAGRCGGCDFQHVSLEGQRRLKAAVLAEQLHRLADIDWDGAVEVVETPGTEDGLHWRTRMRYQVDDEGRVGLRRHRSHEIEPLPPGGCRIAHPDALTETGPGSEVVEHAAGRDWRLATEGFWQVHPGAADTLVEAVLDGLQPEPGERAFDLYCGVGLFTGALVDAGVRAWGVEWDRQAITYARSNVPNAKFTAGKVERVLRTLPKRTDLVVLDPPRTGAGKAVIDAVVARRPRAIAYVACDPAALARDLARAARCGYRPASIRAFDLFPMTHHLEAVAIVHR